MDHAVEATKMLDGGINPGLSRRWVLSRIGLKQDPFTPNQIRVKGGLPQRFQIAKPKAEAMAVSKSTFSDRSTDPTTCTTNQESAHGYTGEGLQR